MGRLQIGDVTLQQLQLKHAHAQRLHAEQTVRQLQLRAGPPESIGVTLFVAPGKDPLRRDAGCFRFRRFENGDDDSRIVVHGDKEHDRRSLRWEWMPLM